VDYGFYYTPFGKCLEEENEGESSRRFLFSDSTTIEIK
jgi:hypothetical protein